MRTLVIMRHAKAEASAPSDFERRLTERGHADAVEAGSWLAERVAAPDDALLRRVLAKLFADRQVTVDPGVIDFLALRMERSLEAAGLLVEHLDRAALAQGAPISKRLAAVVTAEMFDNQPDFWPEGPI